MLGNSLLRETVEQILKLMLDAAAVLQEIAFQLCKSVFVKIQNANCNNKLDTPW